MLAESVHGIMAESNPALKGEVLRRNAAALERCRTDLKNPGVNAGVSWL